MECMVEQSFQVVYCQVTDLTADSKHKNVWDLMCNFPLNYALVRMRKRSLYSIVYMFVCLSV